jgi:multiple sugar transport system ATP-binding protein
VEVATMLDLQPYLDRRPKELSGGQRQRVAMGRAIVRRPQAFLMDEPLSNLDAKLRVQTRNEIASLQRRLGITTVYVTHDQVEAMTMGDRVAVLCDGVLQQCAPPGELYRSPSNAFVAGFMGSPAMNMFTLPVVDGSVSLGDWRIQVPRQVRTSGREVVVGIRPEHFEVGDRGVGVEVDVVEELGADAHIYGRITAAEPTFGKAIIARVDPYDPPKSGCRVMLYPNEAHIYFFGLDGQRLQ